jgi:hypothetical protein
MIIPGFSLYNISEDGVITRTDTGDKIVPVVTKINNAEYLRACLKDDNGKVRMHSVMKLLAETYLQKPTPTAVPRAIDGDNLHVSVDNIVYVTRSELSKNAWRDGKMEHRRPRQKSWSDDTLDYVYDTLYATGTIKMAKLNGIMDLPYSTIRYAVEELCRRGFVAKTKEGLEIIK